MCSQSGIFLHKTCSPDCCSDICLCCYVLELHRTYWLSATVISSVLNPRLFLWVLHMFMDVLQLAYTLFHLPFNESLSSSIFELHWQPTFVVKCLQSFGSFFAIVLLFNQICGTQTMWLLSIICLKKTSARGEAG